LNNLTSSDNNQKESLNVFKLSAAVASLSSDQVDFLDIERQKVSKKGFKLQLE
jgi:hypothetical protein